MINIVDVVQIQAARSAVWRHFAEIETWNLWNREVISAAWEQGKPWEDGAIFAVEHFTLLKAKRKTRYVVQMHIHERSAVYESTAGFPLGMMSSVQLTDSLGGCRLEATHRYSGPAAPLVWLLRGRQQSLLHGAMLALKAQAEGPKPR